MTDNKIRFKKNGWFSTEDTRRIEFPVSLDAIESVLDIACVLGMESSYFGW